MPTSIDWQGHRGARGLLPENTIPAFLEALKYPVRTLELDVVVSKDSQIIISHEPWFSEHICTKPDGNPVTAAEAHSLRIYEMDYATIQTYDCGQRGNTRFPEQKAMPVAKPSLQEMVVAVEAAAKREKRALPFYNIELKSHSDYYGILTPPPADFVRLALKEIHDLGVFSRVTLQSFDFQILEAIHTQQPDAITAQLIQNTDSFATNVAQLSFQPSIYSPYFETVTQQMVQEVHAKGMRLIPWTVNEVADMRLMMTLGVDGIITDYPNRIAEAVATDN